MLTSQVGHPASFRCSSGKLALASVAICLSSTCLAAHVCGCQSSAAAVVQYGEVQVIVVLDLKLSVGPSVGFLTAIPAWRLVSVVCCCRLQLKYSAADQQAFSGNTDVVGQLTTFSSFSC